MPATTQAPSNLLLLSGGSKVAIARIAKKAAQKRGITLHISDTSANVPCTSFADQFTQLPQHTDPNWESELMQLCKTATIGLIIPTRHCELQALSALVPELKQQGTAVSISSSQTLDICIHKIDTFSFLQSIEAPTPKSCINRDFKNQLDLPLIAKPERGSSSTGITPIQTIEQLRSVPSDWILQEKATGTEFTTNVYITQTGEIACAIPHERITVDSGEVLQAKTRNIPSLVKMCSKVASALPGAQGIINIQAFLNEKSGEISVIEINPRIGGGYPLCDAAKGHYIEWLCQEHLDNKPPPAFPNWTDGLLMQRYREAIFSL